MLTNKKILLVEDDPSLADGLTMSLEAAGYNIVHVARGTEVMELFVNGLFDLVLMDIMLPGKDGITLCKEIRATGSTTPVLFVSARSETEERIEVILSGGDDFIAKPFDVDELKVRIHGIFRRIAWLNSESKSSNEYNFDNCHINFSQYLAKGPNGEFKLTHKECLVLKYLTEREGKVVSRDQLLDAVWGYDVFPSNRTIDNIILKLRKFFEPDQKHPKYFETIRGVGYKFSAK